MLKQPELGRVFASTKPAVESNHMWSRMGGFYTLEDLRDFVKVTKGWDDETRVEFRIVSDGSYVSNIAVRRDVTD